MDTNYRPFRRLLSCLVLLIAMAPGVGAESDPLPSWNATAPKRAIVAFVERVTREGSKDFVPAAERIATFDNDGTLWVEQPIYTQLAFAIDQVKLKAPLHADWKQKEPFASIIHNRPQEALEGGEHAVAQIVAASHAGMTTDAFDNTVKQWIRTAQHPRFRRTYDRCVYQPMVELLAYLRANGFKTFIVSGGGVEFMRAFSEKTYGIPPEQVVGSVGKQKYQLRGTEPVLLKMAEVEFIDDGPGKPAGIQRFIGRRPIAAFGNSDGDREMLEWTTAGPGARFALIVHHDDAEREYAYDRESKVGKLSAALDQAGPKGWTVVSMKDDWKTILPP
jgi:phosphoglycolate phosphatase-like HAD superfamily hydrolase